MTDLGLISVSLGIFFSAKCIRIKFDNVPMIESH